MRNALCLSVLGVLVSLAAFADPPAATTAAPPAQASPQIICLQKYKMELAGLAQLGTRLNLTTAQKPKFDAWRNSMLDMEKEVPCPPPPMGLDTPAPKRVENEITIMSATLNSLRKEEVTLRALYAALTPEQRAVLDGPMRMSAPPPSAPPPSAPPPASH